MSRKDTKEIYQWQVIYLFYGFLLTQFFKQNLAQRKFSNMFDE